MDPQTHIIDPDGDMIIVLHNADSLFAHMPEDMIPGKFFDNLPEPVKTEPLPSQPEDPASGDAPPEDDTVEKQACEGTDKNEFRFQVSAKHMMFASSFFKRALTGAWRESETYQQKGSVEVTADGWDSDALLIILRAIHCQYNQIPKKVTLEMLAKVAAVADYYDCKDVLYIMADIWVSSLDETAPSPKCSRDLALWLWVAWFFKLPEKFTQYTSILMSRSDGLIAFPGLPIPDQVTESMNQSRQEAIDKMMRLLYETREAFLVGIKWCWVFECRSIMYGALTMQIQSSPFLSPRPVTPFAGFSYNDLSRKISSFRSPVWHENLPPLFQSGPRPSTNSHSCPGSSFASLFQVAKWTHCVKGMELDSFKSFNFY